MPPETLEFEEPIAVLLKEIEAMTMLPRTDARQVEIVGDEEADGSPPCAAPTASESVARYATTSWGPLHPIQRSPSTDCLQRVVASVALHT